MARCRRKRSQSPERSGHRLIPKQGRPATRNRATGSRLEIVSSNGPPHSISNGIFPPIIPERSRNVALRLPAWRIRCSALWRQPRHRGPVPVLQHNARELQQPQPGTHRTRQATARQQQLHRQSPGSEGATATERTRWIGIVMGVILIIFPTIEFLQCFLRGL